MKKKYQNYQIIKLLLILFLFFQCDLFNKKYEIYINNYKIFVELAITPEQRQKGLMYRKTLHEDSGMLFVFPESRIQSFWMKNTYIPLDIAFFDEDGYLIEIQSMEPNSEIIYQSSAPAKYALEIRKNWFRDKNIKKYAKLHLTEEVLKKIKELSR